MKKGQIKISEAQIISNATTLQYQKEDYDNFNNYQIEHPLEYPNRLITFVKVKMYDSKKQTYVFKTRGSGCRISQNYVLTSAHNFDDFQKKMHEIEQNKVNSIEDQTQIQQGLGNICKFKISQFFRNKKYKPSNKQQDIGEDYLLLRVTPFQGQSHEQKYMPIVCLSQQTIKNIPVGLQGYPIQFNQKIANEEQDSKIFMKHQVRSNQLIKQVTNSIIVYLNQSQKGLSGGPLIAIYKGIPVIIGIHKGGNTSQNYGVNVGNMLESINQIGYEEQKCPFIYTENTFQFIQKKDRINGESLLLLLNRGLQPRDILVLTAFDLSNMKKITLSGNKIGSLGVEYILRRKFTNLTSLYMNENSIQKLPDQQWENVSNLQYLGLSINLLETLPLGMSKLKKLKELWVSTNMIKIIPQAIGQICQNNTSNKLTIYIYDNFIDMQSNSQMEKKNQLSKFKNQIVWQKV